ncbi:hypothetical protein [Streptomyces sp. Ag109_O5-10]|uniref:hypothetical protein n=1 Tax=Streptomyces sp. Ag109_O5-10 TaxID=1855349 RepID=UPI00089C8400|nr:hypothetical protein [Streptomyces sp. Ag109_O5-10]SEE87461.1 hypothetical protein SAMN05216533_4105 [Streptomyces sp. Ag109_O5-10]
MSPARVYRYVLRNQTTDHNLNLISQHRCFGDWTPGWEPPASINAGEERGFQGESGTIVSGTEGWVKYGITNTSDGSIPGLIYLYWDNPYFGVTHQKISLSGADVRADCDPDEGSAGSTFGVPTASAPPSDLRLAISGTRRDGVPTNVDEISDIYRIPLAPVFIFGTAGIWERMELDLDLRSVPVASTPLFGASPTGPRTLKLMTKTATEDWVGSPGRPGHWSGNSIKVRVDHASTGAPELIISPRHFTVTVDDQTPGWALQYSRECVLDGEELPVGLLHTFADSFSLATPDGGGDGHKEAVSAAAEAVYSAAKQGSRKPAIQRSPSPADVKRIAMELGDRAQSFGLSDSRILRTIPGAMAALMHQATFTMFPSSGTTLQLFQVQVNREPVDMVLRYVRTTPDGHVFVDEYLSWYPDLH